MLFDSNFAQIFRAIERIRKQLASSDAAMRQYLAEELTSLKQLGTQYFDHWMALDDQIHELAETYELTIGTESVPATTSAADAMHIETLATHNDDVASAAQSTTAVRTGIECSLPTRTLVANTVAITPPSWETEAHDWSDVLSTSFRRGMAYYDLLMFDDAARLLAQVVEKVDEPIVRLYLGAAHAAQGRTVEATQELEYVRQMSTEERIVTATYEIEAFILCQNRQVDKALQCFEVITKQCPTYSDAWYNLGVCHFHQRDYGRAQTAFLHALHLSPDDAACCQYLAICFLAGGDFGSAIQHCSHALAQKPRHLGVLIAYSHILIKLGRREEGLAVCARIHSVQPTCADAYLHAAWHHLRHGDTTSARLILKKLLTIQPKHPEALLQFGVVCFMENDLENAESSLHAALLGHVDKATVWIALGRISAQKKQYDRAHRRFLRALADHRKAIKRLALYYHAQMLIDRQRPREAEKLLKAAAILGQPNPAILLALSEVSHILGRPQEAQSLHKRATRILEKRNIQVRTVFQEI